jgi:hypothetical protein
MECVYPSVVHHGTFEDFLRLKEHLAFVGYKNAGDPGLRSYRVSIRRWWERGMRSQ